MQNPAVNRVQRVTNKNLCDSILPQVSPTLPLSTENGFGSHQQRCDQLIDSTHLKGWERLFIKALRDSKAINSRDEEKLAAIEAKIGGAE